jgi:acetylglutamate/LysW-gamma-L-alpha-aminoadipate kinase
VKILLIVLKIGGDLLKDKLSHCLINEIKTLSENKKIIIIHGGGDIVTDISTKLGHPPTFVVSPKGFRSRYTDKETMDIFTMVMAGKINKEIISSLQANGINAIGLSGLDGGLVKANRKKQIIVINERGRRMLLEGDHSGTITGINESLLRLLLDNGFIPVISSIAIGEQAEPLNVDGDRMAANIASAIQADKLVLLTDVEGVLLNNKLVSKLESYEARDILDKIGPGMITKLYAAIEALDKGVKEVFISSGLKENSVSEALNYRNGTVIVK